MRSEAFFHEIDDLEALCDSEGVRRRTTTDVDAAVARAYDAVTARYNALLERYNTIYTYIDVTSQPMPGTRPLARRKSILDARAVKSIIFRPVMLPGVGPCDIQGLIQHSRIAAEHSYALQEAKFLAEHQMSEAEEESAAPSAQRG